MLQKGKIVIYLVLLLSITIYGSMFAISGCGSDSTTSNTTPDTNVVKHDSISAFPSGKNSVDLYGGLTVSSADPTKDISIVSNGLNGYKIQTGSSLPPGNNTMFVLVDTNDTKVVFDAMGSVPAWGTTIDPAIFTLSQTGSIVAGQVYGFYLQGKFASGTLTTKTYGILRIATVTSGGLTQPQVVINVKLNKSGANKFN